ncbi:MAG: hypothetical protein PVI00_11985 [Desulfobacterales bacterium]|jgi:hypothetical protein
MSDPKKSKKSTIKIGPSDKPYAKLIFTEKRFGLYDRRKLHTYIADDRRSGIADRRKSLSKNAIHIGLGRSKKMLMF